MNIFIAGAGTMGAGIAETFAAGGHAVKLYDTVDAAVESGIRRIRHSLDARLKEGQLDAAERDAVLARITPETALESAADADWVIEAVFENLEVKQELFLALDAVCKPDAVFASNTLSLPITEIASGLDHAPRTLGLHFFNPAPLTGLVEVVTTLVTEPAVREAGVELVRALGKHPVVTTDYPGFVVNRLVMPQINEAANLVLQGLATAEEIDRALVLSNNHCSGPLRQADAIGLDTVLQILENLYQETQDARYRPCPLLVRMTQAGWLGRKTGRGFYRYT